MRIDAHHHFWQYNPIRDTWIDEHMSVIQRDFMPSDLLPLLADQKIDGSVVVQADQSMIETNFLLDLARQNHFIKGVVGWIDLQAVDLKVQLEKLSEESLLKGFRHIAQAERNDFLADPIIDQGIKVLTELEYTFDILIYPSQLPAAIRLVQQNPNQSFVIDHLAKPFIKDRIFEPWKKLINEIADYPNVSCKVSGMITEADLKTWTSKDMHPYLDIIFNAFGVDRLLFGSDWPVCLLAGSYAQVHELVWGYCDSLTESEKGAIFGESAIKFYNL